jgi:MFS family permease
VAYVIGGGGNGVANVALRSAIGHRVPPHQLGRAFATFGGLASAADISSSALGGLLVETVGVRGAMIALGAAGSVVGLAGILGYLALPTGVRAMPPSEAPPIEEQIPDALPEALPPHPGAAGPATAQETAAAVMAHPDKMTHPDAQPADPDRPG